MHNAMRRAGWMLAGVCAAATPAYAVGPADNLLLRVGAGMRYEDNVFRQPDGVQTAAPDGSLGRSDTIYTYSAGGSYSVPIGRQRISLSADFNQTRYQQFNNLDFDGEDLRALWKWELGPLLNGDAGITRARYQPGFVTLTNQGNTVIGAGPNVRTSTQEFVTANLPFHANWAANAGMTETRTKNSDLANTVSDNTTRSQTGGLRYISGRQNYVGVQGTWSETDFTTPQVIGGVTFDNSYDTTTYAVVASMETGGASRVTGNLGHTERTQKQAGRPNFSGMTGSLLFNWAVSGLTTVNALVSHELAPASDLTLAGSKTTSFALLPTYAATGQITVLGNFQYQIRDFSASPIPTLGGPAREDRVSLAGLSVVYNPLRTLFINLSYQHERRNSTLAPYDYGANIYFVNAQWTF